MANQINGVIKMVRSLHNIHTFRIVSALAVPAGILTAATSLSSTIFTFSSLGVILAYLRRCLLQTKTREKDKERSQFFMVWLISTVLSLMIIFHLFVIKQLEILPEENILLLLLTTFSVACLYNVKQKANQSAQILKDTKPDVESTSSNQNLINSNHPAYCLYCQANIPKNGGHCVWLNCCIGNENKTLFSCGLLLGMIALFYGSNLTLTTVCHPFIFYKTILLPDDCTDVYYEYNIAICFVCGIYSLIIGSLILLFFVIEIFQYIKGLYCD